MPALACALVASPQADAQQRHALLPKDGCVRIAPADLDALLETWTSALAQSGLDRLHELYAEDAVFSAPGLHALVTGHAAIRAQFASQKNRAARMHILTRIVNFDCNRTIVAGTYVQVPAGTSPERANATPMRFRLDLRLREQRWLIEQHQLSHVTANSEHAVKIGASRSFGPTAVIKPAPARGRSQGAGIASESATYKAGTWIDGRPAY
jgi:uncharacterized protein (TIGR02246 family)